MSVILLYVDQADCNAFFQSALQPAHQLYFAGDIGEAMTMLLERKIDLIISRVFLREQNMFEFLVKVKANPRLNHIPFLCFVGVHSVIARAFNGCLAASALALGACGYLKIEDFCRNGSCDLARIRQAVEKYLPTSGSDFGQPLGINCSRKI